MAAILVPELGGRALLVLLGDGRGCLLWASSFDFLVSCIVCLATISHMWFDVKMQTKKTCEPILPNGTVLIM